jgi:2-polyprenyl-3-methyl-5-hydroxy-6-metoxy-1,4-benzoquinol methylase
MPIDANPAAMWRCHFCQNDQLKALFSEQRRERTYTSYFCPLCDVYQTLGQVEALSPDYIDLEDQDLDFDHRFLQTEHKLTAFRQWKNLMERHTHQTLEGASVMDVGCGIGGFLDYAHSLNLQTYGFDVSKAHVKLASAKHGMVRCVSSFNDYSRVLGTPPMIDMVTMWDVFEHVRDPVRFLVDIRQALTSSGGTLFISVPNGAVNPIKVRLAAARHAPPGLIPWEHVFYYTPQSLRRVVEAAGFEVMAVGGVLPYLRQPLTGHEWLRRLAHHMLRHTRFSFQLYLLARPL